MTNPSAAVLVKVSGDGHALANALSAGEGWHVEPILTVPARDADGNALAAGVGGASTWLRVEASTAADAPWDTAHAMLAPGSAFAAALPVEDLQALEPDIAQQWICDDDIDGDGIHLASGSQCDFKDQTDKGGRAPGPRRAWHLDGEFAELKTARTRVGDKQRAIRVAHLDTGYDAAHSTRPRYLRTELQRNFVRNENPADATDQVPAGMGMIRNRGHGTGTLGLLAGGVINPLPPEWQGFSGDIGGAPDVDVIPIRIADWVVRFSVSTMVQGFDWARMHGAQVLSMSMGGVASHALVDAVNLAYESGLVMVTAAGNNFSRMPTPKTTVFPARFRRVLSACGVMADGRPYTGLDWGTMQGNHGPAEKMHTSLGAYTPNTSWAKLGCGHIVDMRGAGTSAATPQIAAAAALWLAEHWATVSQYPQAWMRVEAARRALFTTAAKTTAQMNAQRVFETIGQGVLRAGDALAALPVPAAQLVRSPPAQASWSWINVLLGQGGVSITQRIPPVRRDMLALELTQMAQRVRAVDDAIDDPERPAEAIPPAARSRYLDAALAEGHPSKPLKAVLESLLGQASAAKPPPSSSNRLVRRGPRPTAPPRRRLRVYALDPSLGRRLASSALRETVLTLPWDHVPATGAAMKPGPIGEYLEVVDVDPASGKVYDPVDLNDRYLLAQDGLNPSEGNPRFHQQMVYAVAMTTIGHFERALGRPALWASNDKVETRRLRLYPHALRDENAYYSPEKRAILFGYFQSRSSSSDSVAPGSMVFTCLSSDIVAHEMTHALLDGLHRRFEEASNPDVVAFHEAFADIVALFQHFMITELVRFEISQAHGNLTAAKLLGGLAKEFGEGANRHGPLRDYVGPEVATLDYAKTDEPHARGSILVHAVYDAFVSAVAHRTADLVRIATGGTGEIPVGALHPDLVARLATETCETAADFLQVLIRALDYCPSVDITFGEYLRAIITADRDIDAEDRHGHRTAIMEAFAERGILPSDVRTMSEETLAWGTFDEAQPAWLEDVLTAVKIPWNEELDRSQLFRLGEDNRWKVWHALHKVFAAHPDVLREFGLSPKVPRYNADGSVHSTPGDGETTFEVHNVRIARRLAPDGSFRTEIVAVIAQRQPLLRDSEDPAKGFTWFRGGATLIFDPREGKREIRYSILKNSGSASRQQRQRETTARGYLSPLRQLYFGGETAEPFALIHANRGAKRGY